MVLLGTRLRGSLKVPHKPFGEGGLPWQVPKPNLGVMILMSVLDLWRGLIIASCPSDRLCLYFKCLR